MKTTCKTASIPTEIGYMLAVNAPHAASTAYKTLRPSMSVLTAAVLGTLVTNDFAERIAACISKDVIDSF